MNVWRATCNERGGASFITVTSRRRPWGDRVWIGTAFAVATRSYMGSGSATGVGRWCRANGHHNPHFGGGGSQPRASKYEDSCRCTHRGKNGCTGNDPYLSERVGCPVHRRCTGHSNGSFVRFDAGCMHGSDVRWGDHGRMRPFVSTKYQRSVVRT